MPNPTVKYSNGFDLIKVQEALVGLVGWQQPTITGSSTLSDDNKTSRSGRYFNDSSFHAVVTPNIIKSVQENPSINDTQLNALLLNLQKSCINRALSGVFNQPEFIENVLVYEADHQLNETITPRGKFVGYEINVAKLSDITVQLNSVVLMFDQDVTFTLSLFKEGKRTAIWTQSVDVVAYEATSVNLTDCYLNYAKDKAAKFYFGYFQDDLNSAKAIREDVCFQPTRMFGIEPVELQVVNGVLQSRTESYSSYPYGFNLQASSFMDQTQNIITKSYLFTELIGLQMAYMVVEQMMYAMRKNGTERELKDTFMSIGLQMDLNGAVPVENSPQIMGLKQRIDRELKRVKDQFYPKKKSTVVNLAEECH